MHYYCVHLGYLFDKAEKYLLPAYLCYVLKISRNLVSKRLQFFNCSRWFRGFMSFFHIIRLIIIFAILGNGINKKGIKEQPQKGVFIEAIWKSWHWNCSISIVLGIGIGIGIAKNLFLPAEIVFFEKIIFMFFIVLSYGISTTLLQILISLRFPIHSSKGIPLVF